MKRAPPSLPRVSILDAISAEGREDHGERSQSRRREPPVATRHAVGPTSAAIRLRDPAMVAMIDAAIAAKGITTAPVKPAVAPDTKTASVIAQMVARPPVPPPSPPPPNTIDAERLRCIEPLPKLTRLVGTPANAPPTMLWLKPTDLHVDESYQRNLSRASVRLISRIVANWNWSHFKPPIVVKDEDSNRFYVLDGQHTAIAAASHSAIDKIPVMVVDAEQVADRAKAFIGHNRDRVSVTPTQLHHAALIAGDAEAVAIADVCKEAGVSILRKPPPNGNYRPGETTALQAIRGLLRKHGVGKTRAVLSCLVQAECAPIRAMEMRALAIVLDSEVSGLTAEQAVTALGAQTYDEAIEQARELAASSALPIAEALAAVYVRAIKAPEEAAA